MAEDRFTLAGLDPDHSVLVGWDAKKATFYAHVWAGDAAAPPLWSCGTQPREVASITLLAEVLAPWADLSREARAVLDAAHARWSRHQTAAHREARLVAIRAVLPPPFLLRGERAGITTTIERVETSTIAGAEHAGWQQASALIHFDGPDRSMTALHTIALDSERHEALVHRLDGVNTGVGRLLALQSTGVLRDAGVRTIKGQAAMGSAWGQILAQGWSGPPAQNLEALRSAVEQGTAELYRRGNPQIVKAFLAALMAEVGAKATRSLPALMGCTTPTGGATPTTTSGAKPSSVPHPAASQSAPAAGSCSTRASSASRASARSRIWSAALPLTCLSNPASCLTGNRETTPETVDRRSA